MNVLVDHGKEQRPYPDGPMVRAVDLEIVRQEFYRCYLAEGDTEANNRQPGETPSSAPEETPKPAA